MKAISHPSKQYENYNKVLQFINFPISFCFAIENLWITALMIAYETPNIVDAFIWIIPNIIAILIRPTLIRYVHRVFSPRQAELALVSHFLIGGTIGCGLVALSSQYFQDFYRIIVCSMGWTLMDVSFQMVLFFSEKGRERLQKLGYKQIQEERNHSAVAGEALGYLISFGLCTMRGGRVMKKFFSASSDIYLIATALSSLYWLTLYISSYDRHTLLSTPLPSSPSPLQSPAHFLPGYHELRRSSGFDRWLLALHFLYLYIVDVLLIYGSMWIVMVYEDTLGEKQGVAYNLGMKEGSLVLLAFTGFSWVDIGGMLAHRLQLSLDKTIKYFLALLLTICLSSLLLFQTQTHIPIFLLSTLIGTANGLYTSTLQPQLATQYPIFESCAQLVNRIEKIFILSVMPAFVVIGLGRNDISDCLVSLPVGVFGVVGLRAVWRELRVQGREGRKKKKLEKIDKHL